MHSGASDRLIDIATARACCPVARPCAQHGALLHRAYTRATKSCMTSRHVSICSGLVHYAAVLFF